MADLGLNLDEIIARRKKSPCLGNGGLGRSSLNLDSMATLKILLWATAFATNLASLSRQFHDGLAGRAKPISGLLTVTPWENRSAYSGLSP